MNWAIRQETTVYQSVVESFCERWLSCLARQWSFLFDGRAIFEKKSFILDPEAMLLATWRWGRCDARLFDEALRWCCYWGDEIDIARLQALLRVEKEEEIGRIAGAFASVVVALGGKKRWEALIKKAQKQERRESLQPLFLAKDGSPLPSFGEAEPFFGEYGFFRGSFELRSSSPVVLWAKGGEGLRFLLRRLVGMGSKAEALLALLTHEGRTIKEMAIHSGFTERSLLQSLDDLEKTGLVFSMEIKGAKRRYPVKRYFLEKKRWWSFLQPSGGETLTIGLDWLNLYRAVGSVWAGIRELSNVDPSDYKVRSVFGRAMKEAQESLFVAGFQEPLWSAFVLRERDFLDAFSSFWLAFWGRIVENTDG